MVCTQSTARVEHIKTWGASGYHGARANATTPLPWTQALSLLRWTRAKSTGRRMMTKRTRRPRQGPEPRRKRRRKVCANSRLVFLERFSLLACGLRIFSSACFSRSLPPLMNACERYLLAGSGYLRPFKVLKPNHLALRAHQTRALPPLRLRASSMRERSATSVQWRRTALAMKVWYYSMRAPCVPSWSLVHF